MITNHIKRKYFNHETIRAPSPTPFCWILTKQPPSNSCCLAIVSMTINLMTKLLSFNAQILSAGNLKLKYQHKQTLCPVYTNYSPLKPCIVAHQVLGNVEKCTPLLSKYFIFFFNFFFYEKKNLHKENC